MSDNLIRSIAIEGFRAFEHFEMRDLGRINLLVGKNNCGKTSVLEAIKVGASETGLDGIWQILEGRGDVEQHAVDISALFTGYRLEPNSRFGITLNFADGRGRIMGCEIMLGCEQGDRGLYHDHDLMDARRFLNGEPLHLYAVVTFGDQVDEPSIAVPLAELKLLKTIVGRHHAANTLATPHLPCNFIPAEGSTSAELAERYEFLRLTPEESEVVVLLRTLDADVSQLATNQSFRQGEKDFKKNFKVALVGHPFPLPFSVLGEGAWRMLGLAVALGNSKGGFLLVDEIDTGLHFSVMEKMWKLVYEGAKRLNVQVFATTHSRDCVEALASIAVDETGEEADVTIQRIEKGKNEPIGFRGGEIVVAAERDIEVR